MQEKTNKPTTDDPAHKTAGATTATVLPAATGSVATLLGLQSTVGNQAAQRALSRGAVMRYTGNALVQRHGGPTIANPAGGIFGKLFGGGKVKTDAEKKKSEISSLLGKSSAGKAALKIIDQYKVTVDYEAPGPGSTYQGPAPGKINLEATVPAEEAAFILVHEANHAKASNEGKTADVTALGRDVYVKTMINEETDSTVASIDAKRGMSSGAQKKLTATPVMEERYNTAYEAAYKAAKDAKKSTAEAAKAAQAAGWKSINDAFYDGSLVTSNTGETYGVYYGSFWDTVNAPPVIPTVAPTGGGGGDATPTAGPDSTPPTGGDGTAVV